MGKRWLREGLRRLVSVRRGRCGARRRRIRGNGMRRNRRCGAWRGRRRRWRLELRNTVESVGRLAIGGACHVDQLAGCAFFANFFGNAAGKAFQCALCDVLRGSVFQRLRRQANHYDAATFLDFLHNGVEEIVKGTQLAGVFDADGGPRRDGRKQGGGQGDGQCRGQAQRRAMRRHELPPDDALMVNASWHPPAGAHKGRARKEPGEQAGQ